jgi:hypothetical protein
VQQVLDLKAGDVVNSAFFNSSTFVVYWWLHAQKPVNAPIAKTVMRDVSKIPPPIRALPDQPKFFRLIAGATKNIIKRELSNILMFGGVGYFGQF